METDLGEDGRLEIDFALTACETDAVDRGLLVTGLEAAEYVLVEDLDSERFRAAERSSAKKEELDFGFGAEDTGAASEDVTCLNRLSDAPWISCSKFEDMAECAVALEEAVS